MLNLSIMSAEEIVRWFEPKTETEKILFDALASQVQIVDSCDYEDYKEQADNLERDLDDANDRIGDLERELDEANDRIGDLERELDEANDRIYELEQ